MNMQKQLKGTLALIAKGLGALAVCLLVCQQASAMDKDTLLAKYRNKFVVVEKEGLAVGLSFGLWVNLDETGLPHKKACVNCRPEPLKKGEVLKVSHVNVSSGHLFLELKNVTPHAVTFDTGKLRLGVPAGSHGKDFDMTDALLAQWFKPFDTAAAAAARFGNTAGGVLVKEVKAGMSFGEVEGALGVPVTRVDLGDKVLYKYKDTTVEFHDGKVVDVR